MQYTAVHPHSVILYRNDDDGIKRKVTSQEELPAKFQIAEACENKDSETREYLALAATVSSFKQMRDEGGIVT